MEELIETEERLLAVVAKMSEAKHNAGVENNPPPEFQPIKITNDLMVKLKAAPEYTHHWAFDSETETFFGFVIKTA